jgi:hypothetical protein
VGYTWPESIPPNLWPHDLLCAQVVGHPNWFLTNIPWLHPTDALLFLVDVGTQYAVTFFFQLQPHPGSHFPYGFHVLPDLH